MIIEPMVAAIRWLLIGLWTVVVALLPQVDEDWTTFFGVVGGFIVVITILVLVVCSIGQ